MHVLTENILRHLVNLKIICLRSRRMPQWLFDGVANFSLGNWLIVQISRNNLMIHRGDCSSSETDLVGRMPDWFESNASALLAVQKLYDVSLNEFQDLVTVKGCTAWQEVFQQRLEQCRLEKLFSKEKISSVIRAIYIRKRHVRGRL